MSGQAHPVSGRAYRVRGVVQGVGFRWWTRREAVSIGVAGTVRNDPDGSVRVTAWGEDAALAELERRLGVGPPGARVEGVELLSSPSSPAPAGFTIEG